MKNADDILAAIDALHPLERRRLGECLGLDETPIDVLSREVMVRYLQNNDDSVAIVALADRIYDVRWLRLTTANHSTPPAAA